MHRKRNSRQWTQAVVIDGQEYTVTVTRSWVPVIVHSVILAGGLAIGWLLIVAGLAR